MSRVVAFVCVLSLAGPACSSGSAEPVAATKAPPSPSPSASVVINPPGVVVENEALGPSEKRVRRAMRDLKAVNLWRPLTRHLYKIKFQSRLGASSIPDDGHLADAFLTVGFGETAQGRLCDVMFFPNAIARDVARLRTYYAWGAIAEPPPTLRQLWGAVTAHELGHCFPGGSGEKVARKWESKALARLRKLSP